MSDLPLITFVPKSLGNLQSKNLMNEKSKEVIFCSLWIILITENKVYKQDYITEKHQNAKKYYY